eukprot:TRINITY_DN1442_c0_g1_i1.p1 TRINITY_DN1442_c0_g1~~TRINITY_DN1442_c0_g1_i1.p1  ORF type:complete len:149 (-),score=39.15 TRINITY_DN1442_c0_g1_i1:408-854(-)
MSNVTDEYREDLREAFNIFDKNRDGSISIVELEAVLESLSPGNKPSRHDVEMMMKKVDQDGNGEISFDEFVVLMASTRQSPDDELRQAFKVFDIDGNGTIDKDELKQVMIKLGQKVTNEQIEEMIKASDQNGDGKIDYNEFIHMMKSI